LIETPAGESCPACGSRQTRTLFGGTDRLYHTTDKSFQVVECQGCRLMRLFPWPSPDELKTYYPDQYWFSAEARTADRLENMYRRFVLRDHVGFVRGALSGVKIKGPVLDVGCGGGLFTRMLGEQGFPVMGLDFSSEAASIAWHENGVPVTCGTLSSAPFRPGSCAAITMFHVLEHLYDPVSYLQAAHSLLHDEGRLVIQVPNAECWQFLLFGEAWNGIDIPRHLINFRARDMESLLGLCGFEVVRRKFFSLRDNPAGFASSLAPGLDPMARRVRGLKESPRGRLIRDLIYLGLVVCAVPFTILEAACRAGSTVMMEARKKK
jgi:2-polyprenyl-3-methyl-5-hydroxy-6-metoxy-1,4-benzoquinol methylase